MDIVGPLPATKNDNRYILVVVCPATRYPLAFAMPDATAASVARLLVDEIILRYSPPDVILTDMGSHFTAELIREICTLFAMRQVFSSGYRPQTSGLVQSFNRTLVDMLALTGGVPGRVGCVAPLRAVRIPHGVQSSGARHAVLPAARL